MSVPIIIDDEGGIGPGDSGGGGNGGSGVGGGGGGFDPGGGGEPIGGGGGTGGSGGTVGGGAVSPSDGIILALPNPLQLATGVEASEQVGGSITINGVPLTFRLNDFIVNGDWAITGAFLRKSSGSAFSDSYIINNFDIPKARPFLHTGSFDNYQSFDYQFLISIQASNGWSVAFKGDFDGGSDEYDWEIFVNNVVVATGVAHAFDEVNLFSNGTTIAVSVGHNGFHQVKAVASIPPDVSFLRGLFNVNTANGRIAWAGQRLDTFTTAYDTSNLTAVLEPDNQSSIRAIDLSHFGVTVDVVGDRVLHLSHVQGAVLDIPVIVTALYIRPQNGPCGGYVIADTVIAFESNGGNGGIFEATGGTNLSNLRWQAPTEPGPVFFTYRIGNVTANCMLNVVPRLKVYGVEDDGYYGEDMAQGDTEQFYASVENAVFTSPNYAGIISTTGKLIAPTDAQDEFFGEKDVLVKVEGAIQTYFFRVRIQAMFPTPKFCGAIPEKWLKHDPDFLPTTLTMSGGTSQVKNKNKQGVTLWDVSYSQLILKETETCTCSPAGHATGCSSALATAERLSKFYIAMDGEVKYFTVLDYNTGIRYKYVRITSWKVDHVLYFSEQTRQVSMRHEGAWLFIHPIVIVPSITDTTPPVKPIIVSANGLDSSSIELTWLATTDNVAVTVYQYRIDGGAWVNAGNLLIALIFGLAEATLYTFEVRAGDAAGNWSVPSDPVDGMTLGSGDSDELYSDPDDGSALLIDDDGFTIF